MQQHPVPKNIIDVEFKLFGAFSLRQFSKILTGFLVAIIIFVLPIIPIYIKLPFIAFSALVGIGSALSDNLWTWVSQIIKAIFVSPRYVWVKEKHTPEALQSSGSGERAKNKKIVQQKTRRTIDLTEIPLEKLLATRSESGPTSDVDIFDDDPSPDPVKKQNVEARTKNLSQRFDTEFEGTTPVVKPMQRKSNSSAVASGTKLVTREDYEQELEKLKKELQVISAKEQDQEMETQLIQRINTLTEQLKLVAPGSDIVKNLKSPEGTRTDFQGGRLTGAQNILGILVDKKDQPVAGATVIFKNTETGDEFETVSSGNGRFTTQMQLPQGSYDVKIKNSKKKFHTYQIDVGGMKLPAYKFRER